MEKDIIKPKSKSIMNEKEILEIILNNHTEYYLNMKPKTTKSESIKKINFSKDYEQINFMESDTNDIPNFRLIRSNSVDLYKKRKKEREMKNNNKSNKNDNNQNAVENNINKMNDNYNNNQKILILNKRVKFLEPQFVTIIDVESYKKYNEENTCKDPYKDFFNDNDNKNKNNEKAKAVCSCSII